MALVSMGNKGNFVHVYDFRVKPGTGDEFVRLFDTFDYSDANPMHKSSAQVKDGILCRDTQDPDHFYLLGEWADIGAHRQILQQLRELRPEFVTLIEGGTFVPTYAEIVSSTPQAILDQAAR
jgi:quinol monooxygenase YgiN